MNTGTKTEKPKKKNNNQILISARQRMKQLLILSVLCRIGYAKDRGSHSYIARNTLMFFCFPKFLHVSYFYLRTETHEAIADCGIDLVSCTTGLYFPHSSTFLIRSRCHGVPKKLFGQIYQQYIVLLFPKVSSFEIHI